MKALETLCVDGSIARSKHDLIEAIDNLLLNIARNYFAQSQAYEKQGDDYHAIFQIRQAIKGDLNEYLSEKMPNSRTVFDRLAELFDNEWELIDFIQKMKDNIVLSYDWCKNSDLSSDAVWEDYNLLNKLLKAFSEDLKWSKNAFLHSGNGENARQIIESGLEALKNLWQRYLYTQKASDYLNFFNVAEIVKNSIERYQINDENE